MVTCSLKPVSLPFDVFSVFVFCIFCLSFSSSLLSVLSSFVSAQFQMPCPSASMRGTGAVFSILHSSAVMVGDVRQQKACPAVDFFRRPCSTRFTRVLSHASAFRRGKTFVCRKISPFPSVRLRFPSSVSHTLSVRQRRRHDKTQFREARMEHERPPLAEIRRKQAFPCCLSPD